MSLRLDSSSRATLARSILLLAFVLLSTRAEAFTPNQAKSKVVLNYLFMQPNASAPMSVEGIGASEVHDYGSSVLAYVPKAAVSGLSHLAKALGFTFQLADDFDVMYLPGGAVDARVGVEKAFPGKPLEPPYSEAQRGLYIVQFEGPIANEWLDDLRLAGGTRVQYIANNALLVVAYPRDVHQIERLPEVQFVDRFHPFLKPWLRVPIGTTSKTYVQVANVSDSEEALAEVSRRSSTPIEIHRSREEILVVASLGRDDIEVLIRHPLIFGIVDYPTFALSDERVATSMTRSTVDGSPTSPALYKAWLADTCPYCTTLQSDGFWLALADTGLDGGDPSKPGNSGAIHHNDLPNSRIRYGTSFLSPADPTLKDQVFHGTATAGVAAGDPPPNGPTDDGGYFWGTGVAPSAGVFVTQLDSANPAPIWQLAGDARVSASPPAYIQNHSYNQYTTLYPPDQFGGCRPDAHPYDGRYSIVSRNFDRAVYDADDQTALANDTGTVTPVTLTVSAGNRQPQSQNYNSVTSTTCADGRLTLPPATAKNVIAVGAAENVRSASEQWNCLWSQATNFNNIAQVSKHGTATAGWHKPDLYAPGSSVSILRSSAVTANLVCLDGDYWWDQQPPETNSTSDVPATYYGDTGTSFSAPAAAAAALLASRVFAETVSPNCHATANCDAGAAKPSLLKAMLIAGARTMRTGIDRADPLDPRITGTANVGTMPNDRQGFGRLSLEDVLAGYPSHTYINENLSLTTPASSIWTRTFTRSLLSGPTFQLSRPSPTLQRATAFPR